MYPYKPFRIKCTDEPCTITPRTCVTKVNSVKFYLMWTMNSAHPFKTHIHTELERRVRAQGQTDHKASSTHRVHRSSLGMITAMDATSTRDLISNFLKHT